MRIYLVRHGRSAANRELRYCGWWETQLTPEGYRQARQAAAFLAAEGVNRLFSSDLGRAAETARVIGDLCGQRPILTPLLRETHFGRFEGMTYGEIEASWRKELSLWLADPFHLPPPGGESLREVEERTLSFLRLAERERRPGETIAAVSHGGAIRSLLRRLLGLGQKAFWELVVDNGSISLLEKRDGDFAVIYCNRVEHLKEDKMEEESDTDGRQDNF